MTNALKMNMCQSFFPTYSNDTLDSNRSTTKIKYIFEFAYGDFYSTGFTYKPILKVDPNNFVPDSNDPEKNIWGFQVNNLDHIVNVNNKLELDTNGIYKNTIILQKPWQNGRF